MSLAAAECLGRARVAQASWMALSWRERVQTLTRLRLCIAAERDQIVQTIAMETQKPALDALGGDVLVTLEQMWYYERHAAGLLRPRSVGKSRLFYGGCRFEESFEPHGVALVFGPANYPLQLSMIPAISALYAGNAAILKCSERTPATARLLADVCARAGLLQDLMQVVWDDPKSSAALIEARPDVVFFTGSTANGRAVAERAGRLSIPCVLELGGKDAAIVFDDCNLDRTVEGVVYGAFAHAGQVCVGIKRLYVQQGIAREFFERLIARAARLRVGSEPDCDFNCLPDGDGRARMQSQVREALDSGARLEYPHDGAKIEDGPVILSGVPRTSRLLNEECFGPVLCTATFATEAEAVMLANNCEFALGASVWSRDLRKAGRVAAALKTGTCAINDVIRNIANPAAAFGGNQASGYGRYRGAAGLYAFSRTKTVMVNAGKRKLERNWFPFTHETYRRLNQLIELRHRPHGFLAAIRKTIGAAALLCMLPAWSSAQAPSPAHLGLNVHLPHNARGSVAYLVFTSAEGFPNKREKAIRHGFVPVAGAGDYLHVDIGDVTPGRYAVSLYLDQNNNQKLDSNLLGIPREPVGASNNPKARLGPPRFEDCVFELGAQGRTLSIELVVP